MQLLCSSSAVQCSVVTTVIVWPHLLSLSLSGHLTVLTVLTVFIANNEATCLPAFLPCLTEIFLYFLDKIEPDKGLLSYICFSGR